MYIPDPYFRGIPKMGDLKMDNIFWENGYPVLFTCKNGDKIYLCICRTIVKEQKWIIAEISFDILQRLIENKLSIYDAFKSNNNCYCIAKWRKENRQEEYDVRMDSNIPDDELPDKDVFLDDEEESAEYLERVRNRIMQISSSLMDAYLVSDQKEQLYMSHIKIEESEEGLQEYISNVDFSKNHTSLDYSTQNCHVDISDECKYINSKIDSKGFGLAA